MLIVLGIVFFKMEILVFTLFVDEWLLRLIFKAHSLWGASLVAQVKNLPANVGDTGEIPVSEWCLEKEMATHSSILAWEIPWTEKPGRLQSMGAQIVGHDLATKQRFFVDIRMSWAFSMPAWWHWGQK